VSYDAAYEEDIVERSRELQDINPGMTYERALKKARAELTGQRA
jgi:hypothetical protein